MLLQGTSTTEKQKLTEPQARLPLCRLLWPALRSPAGRAHRQACAHKCRVHACTEHKNDVMWHAESLVRYHHETHVRSRLGANCVVSADG